MPAPLTAHLTTPGQSRRVVRTGDAHTCVVCRRDIEKGATAVRTERRAETYYERANANGRGMVQWYKHPACEAAEQAHANELTAAVARAAGAR